MWFKTLLSLTSKIFITLKVTIGSMLNPLIKQTVVRLEKNENSMEIIFKQIRVYVYFYIAVLVRDTTCLVRFLLYEIH